MTDSARHDEDLELAEEDLEDGASAGDDRGAAEAGTGAPDESGDSVTTEDASPPTAARDGQGPDWDEVATLRSEFDSLNDRHLRLAAEFNNFRRRTEQERLTTWARAQAELMNRFLDVLDDLHRVAHLDLSNATVEAIMEGIDLVERKFVRGLEEAGAEMMDPMGEPFDPEVMEAMMRVPAPTDEQTDTVAQVFQKGYSLKGVLVRPARVSVYTQG
jgi:molecular chaperone GrpE